MKLTLEYIGNHQEDNCSGNKHEVSVGRLNCLGQRLPETEENSKRQHEKKSSCDKTESGRKDWNYRKKRNARSEKSKSGHINRGGTVWYIFNLVPYFVNYVKI